MTDQQQKQSDIEEVVGLLRGLSPVQVDIIDSIIKRFALGVESGLLRYDFLSEEAFEFFGIRLSAHHAYSSQPLKKENFEHILEQAFNRAGVSTKPASSMTVRGADLQVGDTTLSLKTEAARGLRPAAITISKLMEAAWIKNVTCEADIPDFIERMVVPHFGNYDRIFILRSYQDPQRRGHVRYDLHEIPKALLERVGTLTPEDFSPLTPKRSTSAPVIVGGRTAFKFRLDGSDDKLTVTHLDTALCPLHAWWSLDAPG